ncbi:MAG: chloride channel protein, partial [Terriglobales bacterium]
MKSIGTTKPFTSLWQWWQGRQEVMSGYSSRVLLETCVIGTFSALAAFIFNQGVIWLSAMRTQVCHQVPAWIALPLIGLAGGTMCGFLVKLSPEITGSGIPQVKAFLKGLPMKLDLRVAVSKLVGGIIALGIGLPLGREGPTVQLGASMAALLGGIGYQSPRHRRQLIAAGAGAGLAAAFNAPLAGVIFIIEELLKEVSSLTIGAALAACFFAGIVSRWLGTHSIDVPPSSIFPSAEFYMHDVPFCLLVGVVAGVLGSLFNNAIMACCKFNDDVLKTRYVLRVALAGLICGTVIALLPESFRDFAGIRELIFS